MVHDDSSGRYAVLHAGSGERICHMDSQVGAGVAAVKRWVRTPQRALGCQAFALVAPAVTPAIQPRVLGAAPTACRSIDLQEDADEVADILAAKLALQRGIPLESLAFKQADALEDILPGLEARGRDRDATGPGAQANRASRSCSSIAMYLPLRPSTRISSCLSAHFLTTVQGLRAASWEHVIDMLTANDGGSQDAALQATQVGAWGQRGRRNKCHHGLHSQPRLRTRTD